MVTNEIELLTAEEAEESGLTEAFLRGEAFIEGRYKFFPDGNLEFKQKNIVFNDKYDSLRVARFKDEKEIFKFVEKISEED